MEFRICGKGFVREGDRAHFTLAATEAGCIEIGADPAEDAFGHVQIRSAGNACLELIVVSPPPAEGNGGKPSVEVDEQDKADIWDLQQDLLARPSARRLRGVNDSGHPVPPMEFPEDKGPRCGKQLPVTL